MPEFECAHPITAIVRIGGGSVDVVAEERTTALVEVAPYDDTEASRAAAANAIVELHGNALTIATPDGSAGWHWRRAGRLRISARIPTDSRLVLRLASATATCTGRYAAAKVNSASGNILIEHLTGGLAANTASADVAAERVGGAAQVRSASGRIGLGTVGGDVNAHTASGDLGIESLGGSLRAVTASGEVHIGEVRRGAVRVKAASGDVTLGVVAGTGVWLDLSTVSGAVRSDLAMAASPQGRTGPAVQLQVRTMSGDIEVRRVAADLPATTRTAS